MGFSSNITAGFYYALIPMTTHRVSIPCPQKRNPAHFIRSIAAILLFLLFINNSWSQCTNAPSLVFANPVLISGTDGQVGATYRFPNVGPGIDAHIQILALGNGALLGGWQRCF